MIMALSFGEFIWSLVIIFFIACFLFLLITILGDLFNSEDLSGGAKAVWVIALVILPLIGSLIYLVARGSGITERAVAKDRRQREMMAEMSASAASPGGGTADEIEKLAALRDKGVLSDEEFAAQKAKLLG